MSLQDSADYQDKFKNLESVALTDTVTVYVPEYGVNVTAIVNEIHFDPIQERVTKLVVGTAKQSFADSSHVQLSDLQDKVTSVQEQADQAAVSANAKNTNYYGSVKPSHPQDGDTWFWVDGDKSGIKVFVNGDWVESVDSATEQKISDNVDKAVTDAKTYSDQAIATNREQVDAEIKTVSDKTAQLESEQAELDTKAQGYANQALADAKADTQATAQKTAQDAQTALNNAETTLQQEISQKVSQADYDAKTGDLSLKVSTAQQTADRAVTTIGDYKQANDGRVSAAESKSEQNSHDITTKVSQTDYDQKTGELSGEISSVKQAAGEINQTVANVQTQVNALNQVNLVNNSQLAIDYSGWHVDSPWGATVTNQLINNGTADSSGAMYVWHNASNNGTWIFSDPIQVTQGITVSASITAAMPSPPSSDVPLALFVMAYDGNRNKVFDYGYNIPTTSLDGTFRTFKVENITVPSGTIWVSLVFGWNVGGDISFGRPMLVIGATVGDYVAGQYVNNDKISTVSQKVDSITSIVSDPAAGLSTRVQTAEGNISTVQSNVSDLQSKQTQTADGLTTEISNRQTGDTNTLTQAQGFTTSSINSYNTSMQSQLTQTSDAIFAQVSATGIRYIRVNGQGNNNNNGTHIVRISLFDSSGTDLLAGKTATLSGPDNPYFNSQSDANGATDGNINTFGYFYPEPNLNNFMVYDLGSVVYTPQRLEVKILATRTYKSVNVQVSPDGKAWRTVLLEDIKGLGSPDINVADTSVSLGGTSSATQLALLKDNWSIGISDNTSALASGIFGDINGMALNGNTVTIDANQTVITGTAFIKDAMIDYISASKLTVGNLDADKVRIINLDVNTLTGDVSRFLETNWDGAYGSTKITSAGMKINTQYIQADFQDFGMDFSYINQKIGGMGISQYTNGEPGLAMRLESDGAYMAWSARNEGDSTGPYINKLAWYRQGKPGLGGNYGFIFEDRVTFNKPINVEGVEQKLVYQPVNYNGSLHPYFGAEGGNSGFTFGNDWIDYMNNGHYYPITRLLTSLSGLGNVAIPTQINSDGRVAGWRNITL
ncbi:hypothetical protein [Leuconostoc holzapfelii]|uniref:F5/8 type C domain-containing protein n=1 Tax=Leuconostoc holzapfelii TaxID=434464 RepID=A0A846ZD26_9LACO|nr:hypothetical protein [Leuconostoc holzapfelii]NKZ18858.1 hypothetical protein [Leuconostoc holzapfelii]